MMYDIVNVILQAVYEFSVRKNVLFETSAEPRFQSIFSPGLYSKKLLDLEEF